MCPASLEGTQDPFQEFRKPAPQNSIAIIRSVRSEDTILEAWNNICDRERGVHRVEILGIPQNSHFKEHWYDLGVERARATQQCSAP